MKTALFLVTAFWGLQTWAQCPFDNLSLNDLKYHPDFMYSQQQERAFPHRLFEQFTDELGDLSRCQVAGVAHVIHNPTETLYTLIYSKEDNCDGGNTYGLALKGTKTDARKVVASIKDQDMRCLPGRPTPTEY